MVSSVTHPIGTHFLDEGEGECQPCHPVRQDGHLVLDIPNPRHMMKEGLTQTTFKRNLARRELSSLGSPVLLDEGTLDVVQRTYLEGGKYFVTESYGFAQQFDKEKKAKYYSNWLERYDALIYSPEALEALLEEEGFHIVA
eukprot:EG_transcript_40485